MRYWILLLILVGNDGVSWLSVGCAQDFSESTLRSFEGKYVRLTTDLNSAEEAKELVASFDAAVPQWIKFWKLPINAVVDWKVDACVMRDKSIFRREGLIPEQIPDFPFGFAMGKQVWVLAQQSEYYTRHLLLHEGVHSLAFHHFKGAGPTWFMEGTAELLATHHGSGEETRVYQIPSSREVVPHWGRFKRMKQIRAEKKIPTLQTVMGYQPNLLGDVESYSWSWAAVLLMHSYPKYHEAFYAAANRGDTGPSFNRDLHRDLKSDWPVMIAQWRLMCHDLDYGFDWSNQRVDLSTADPEWDGKPLQVKVSADRGWQSIGVRLRPKTHLAVTPSGRITVGKSETSGKAWESEAGGITIEYRHGRPLGQLLMCLVSNASDSRAEFIRPLETQPVTKPTTLTTSEFTWLLFRVNDGVDELNDNSGQYVVEISQSKTTR